MNKKLKMSSLLSGGLVLLIILLMGCQKTEIRSSRIQKTLAEKLYRSARRMYYKEHYNQAIKEYQKVIDNYPESKWADDAQHEIGKCFEYQGNYSQALKEYQKIIDNYPRGNKVKSAKLKVEIISNNSEEVLKLYTQEYKYWREGKYEKAIKKCREIVTKYSDSNLAGHAQYFIGMMYQNNLEKFSQAIEEYQKLLNNYPESRWAERAQYEMGKYHYKLIDYSQAIEEFRKLIKAYPRSRYCPRVQFLIGQIYFKEGNYAQAAKEFQEIIINYPKSVWSKRKGPLAPAAQYWIGASCEGQKEWTKAKITYQKVINEYPDIRLPDFESNSTHQAAQVRIDRIDAYHLSKPKIAESEKKKALQVHKNIWQNLLQKAAEDKYSKYAIYASRTLMVRHPEIYLKGDALFLNVIQTYPGFRKVYRIKDVHDRLFYAYTHKMSGESFSWEDVDFDNLKTVRYRELIPNDYPVIPFLDRRMLPALATLKTTDNRVTQLEMAALIYHKNNAEGKSTKKMYIIYCDNESSYLFLSGKLISAKSLSEVKRVNGNPILIFNENHVWYPLMKRDDTDKEPFLKKVVTTYVTSRSQPDLSEFEKKLLSRVKEITALHSTKQEKLAILSSIRATGANISYVGGDPFTSLWRDVIPFAASPFSSWNILMEIIRRGNLLSPMAAYLATKQNLTSMCNEYVEGTATPGWQKTRGHLWWCSHLEYSIDETYRTGGGHCITQANNLSAVLELAKIDHYILTGITYQPRKFPHTYLFVPGYEVIIDDGLIIPDSKSVLYPLWWTQKRLDYLLTIRHNGKWANLMVKNYAGSFTPQEAAQELSYLQVLYKDDIWFISEKWNAKLWLFYFRIRKSEYDETKLFTPISSDEFIKRLNQDKRWEPIVLP